MYQGMNESPLTFHMKIRHAVGIAGYADAAQDEVIERTFMNGIHREINLQVRSSPMTLTHLQKVNYAQRYWAARNPGQDHMQQMLPSNLHEPQQLRNHQQAPVIQPATVNWAGATRKDPAMEDLVEQMSKMTPHIGDLKRQINAQRPVQRFMANPTPATGSNAYPMGTLRCYH